MLTGVRISPQAMTSPQKQSSMPPDPFHDPLMALLPRYGFGSDRPLPGSLRRLTVSENTTYLAVSGSDQLILRVHRRGYHSGEEILSELEWLDALVDDVDVETVRPVAAQDGERLPVITVDGGSHHVSAFCYLEGEEPVVGAHLADRFADLGGITARLHAQVRSWKPSAGFTRKRWNFDALIGEQAIWGDWRAAYDDVEDIQYLEVLCSRLEEKLSGYGEGADRFGLIHGDLRLANLLDDGKRLAVIDFDDCGLGWFAFDFAAAISFYEEDPSIPALQAAWLRGYRQIAAFSRADEAILPTMIMARRLQLTAWLASRAGNDTEGELGEGFAEGTLRLARDYLAGS